MESKKGNAMVWGDTGSGKTAISVDVVQTFLSEQKFNDWRQLRKGIQKNRKNSGDEHHDNQQ